MTKFEKFMVANDAMAMFYENYVEDGCDDIKEYFKRVNQEDYITSAFTWHSAKHPMTISQKDRLDFWKDLNKKWRELLYKEGFTTMNRKFKVGDVVRCVDDSHTTLVAKNNCYTVTTSEWYDPDDGEYYVQVTGITGPGSGMRSNRFRLVPLMCPVQDDGEKENKEHNRVMGDKKEGEMNTTRMKYNSYSFRSEPRMDFICDEAFKDGLKTFLVIGPNNCVLGIQSYRCILEYCGGVMPNVNFCQHPVEFDHERFYTTDDDLSQFFYTLAIIPRTEIDNARAFMKKVTELETEIYDRTKDELEELKQNNDYKTKFTVQSYS